MPLRSAFPIKNKTVAIRPESTIEHENLLGIYTDTFTKWITGGSLKLTGFEKYIHASFCHGSVQAFDHFYIKHHTRRMRFFRGEFMYHIVGLRNSMNWTFIEDEVLHCNDAVIISCPFSDFGDVHPMMLDILKQCTELGIPVLLDMAYACISRDLNVDLSYPCIETITTSLSKAYHGAQFLRAGIRWQKENIDDGIDFFNSNHQLPGHTLASAIYYMQNYSIDWNWNTYGTIYNFVIRDLDLSPTKCILFGLGDTRYQQFNRGSQWNRVCISEEIGEKYASLQS